MCGIYGFHKSLDFTQKKSLELLAEDLKIYSELNELRGSDAYGIAFKTNKKNVVYKLNQKPTQIHKRKDFKNFLNKELFDNANNFFYLGQNRLVTNGSKSLDQNNQPIMTDNIIGVHNGILSNIYSLTDEKLDLKNYEGLNVKSDSLIFYNLLSKLHNNNFLKNFLEIIKKLKGNFSLAFFLKDNDEIFLSSNCGSLYYYYDNKNKIFTFSSEKISLYKFLKKSKIIQSLNIKIDFNKVRQILNETLTYNLKENKLEIFDKNINSNQINQKQIINYYKGKLIYNLHENEKRRTNLVKCTKCILPETYPQIKFDDSGVCNFCNSYEKQIFLGEEKLEKILSKYRKSNGEVDCLFGLSGGRDSCYALHLIKKKYKMNPVAYTYDWGLTTDISRMNASKVCGKLGVEHIIRSADIQKKREYVNLNLQSWLKKPHLGMLPIIQVGDKEFITQGAKIAKELNIGLVIHGAGYQLEQREFFLGFTGVNQKIKNNQPMVSYNLINKIRLFFWYSFQFIKNYNYLNKSIFDNLKGFLIAFFFKHNFLQVFDYEEWDEKKIISTLNNEYDWEEDLKYGPNQWRVGDGQTSLNNLIYYSVAGFSEFDNFRSNQIREGLITRDEASDLVKKDNIVKISNLKNLSEQVGFNLDNIISKIQSIPKLY